MRDDAPVLEAVLAQWSIWGELHCNVDGRSQDMVIKVSSTLSTGNSPSWRWGILGSSAASIEDKVPPFCGGRVGMDYCGILDAPRATQSDGAESARGRVAAALRFKG